ncbi:hypothetical protein O181_078195 [Austropuccinia psidii MF-1]|uniref:Uncharacterized protein n=1 Tax=Austropuccinia psidii MF-1 TaxID=1389203 RepID=A0A9Q3IGQ4_9BASI|nr:hypothetical protein [Austropuccinia psidii MF-1]
MPVQHISPSKNTISQRHQAVLTPKERAPLDCTPSVHQLTSNLDKGPQMEGAAPSRKGGWKPRRSTSFSGLLGGYPGISQGPRSRVGESEDEENYAWAGSPEASEAVKILPILINLFSLKLNQIFSK